MTQTDRAHDRRASPTRQVNSAGLNPDTEINVPTVTNGKAREDLPPSRHPPILGMFCRFVLILGTHSLRACQELPVTVWNTGDVCVLAAKSVSCYFSAIRANGSAGRRIGRPNRPVGEVTEWPKVHAWKACVRATVPRVRIPPSPLIASAAPGNRYPKAPREEEPDLIAPQALRANKKKQEVGWPAVA